MPLISLSFLDVYGDNSLCKHKLFQFTTDLFDVPQISILHLLYFNVCRDRLVITECKQNMTSLRGQASWAKMTSLWRS
jgi:hypothetical protein